jgi:uncharacterized BrkB/YihY/UPF0761 family membrane protein
MSAEKPRPSPDSLAAQLAELQNRPLGNRPVDRVRTRFVRYAERATTWGPLSPVAEVGWRALRRDAAIGGSVLGAALAYRIFIWLLPLVLVLVLGLSLVAGSSSADFLSDAGVTGYFAASVGSAAESTKGWARVTGLVVGLLVLLYQTYALLRALRAVTALAWHLPVRPPASPPRDTLLFLGWIVVFAAASTSAAAIKAQLEVPVDLVAGLATYGLLPAFWVALSWRLLPHAADGWRALLPGAVFVGASIAAIGIFNSLFLFPWLTQREETYGVLGVAAGLLFSFFLIGRAIELAASLNATMWEQRQLGSTLAR